MKNLFLRFALTIDLFFSIVLLVSFLLLVFPILSTIITDSGWGAPLLTEKSFQICSFLKRNLYIPFIFLCFCGWVEFKYWKCLSELFKMFIKLSLISFYVYIMFTLCYPIILKFGN